MFVCFFTHRSKDDAYFQPWTRIHWYDILISTGAFFLLVSARLLSIQLLLLSEEARWEGWGAGGGRLNMAEPLGHQGALAGAPQSAWIPVELIVVGGGWQVTRNRKCRETGRSSTRIRPSTYPRWTWSSRFHQMCPVTATASGCGGLSSPPPWSLSLGVSS